MTTAKVLVAKDEFKGEPTLRDFVLTEEVLHPLKDCGHMEANHIEEGQFKGRYITGTAVGNDVYIYYDGNIVLKKSDDNMEQQQLAQQYFSRREKTFAA